MVRYQNRRVLMAEIGGPDPTWVAELNAQIDELRDQLTAATEQVRVRLHEPAIRALPTGRLEQEHDDWLQQRQEDQQLATKALWEARNHPRHSRGQPSFDYPSATDRGRGISR